MATAPTNTAEQIVDSLGGPGNITSFSHCATRLRFELKDGSLVDAKAVESIPGVMGAVPQGADRMQVVIGGAVETVYNNIHDLPSMQAAGKATLSDADVKAAERAKARGKAAWLDAFFEFLSDSFRPIIGALLGASLFITFMSLMATLGVIGNWADGSVNLGTSWNFVNLTWQGVFVFLPLMVAYNASKKVGADPWVGFAIMAVLMLPGFAAMSKDATSMSVGGSTVSVVNIFGLPLALRDYSSQVFPPLLMAAVLGPLTRGLKRLISEHVQLIFVPFLSMLIMIPLTAFIIGPIGIYAGALLAGGLHAINSFSPLIFAIVVPLAYPFMVPLGLHWPINAIMLLNIKTLGYDYIQGPMGSWNFACFGATAGVLFLATRDRDFQMRQTATGALAAGLLGGISEPSLYGIHLRYKRIYPRMLVGCLVGGLITGFGGGVHTNGFEFTSLLTIPAFFPIPLYAISVVAAFATAMILVVISDYRTPEQRAEFLADRDQAEHDLALEAARTSAAPVHATAGATTSLASGGASLAAASGGTATALATRPTEVIAAPVSGHVVSLDDVSDKVFSSRVLGEGVGIVPNEGRVVSPVDGILLTVPKTGHAYGIKTDDGVEVLVHIGIDTVRLKGENFEVAVEKGQRVAVGDLLGTVNLEGVRAAGYDTTTLLTITNTKAMGSVTPHPGQDVFAGDPVIDVTR